MLIARIPESRRAGTRPAANNEAIQDKRYRAVAFRTLARTWFANRTTPTPAPHERKEASQAQAYEALFGESEGLAFKVT